MVLKTVSCAVAEKRVDLAYTALGQFDLITRYASLDTSALVATSDYAYDSLARLDLLTHQRADSSVINSYDFGYDSLNRITSLNQAIDGLSSFTYDATHQLTAADHATQTDENYSYDLNGNRTDAGNVAGAANRLLEDATFVYEYDAEGNTIRQTRKSAAAANDVITEFVWDHRNRLVEVTQKNNSGESTVRVEYDYDVTDHMVGRREFLGNSTTPAKSEHFVWDGWNIALILDGAGAVVERRFNGDAADQVFASEDALNEVTWLLADHLNTPRDFLDSAGTLLNHRVYDSFGLITSETNSSVGSNIAFTGGYRDTVTNLIYRWHRWYSPHAHRWLSEDPIQDGTNWHAYVGNDSINLIDPEGLQRSRPKQDWTRGVVESHRSIFSPPVGDWPVDLANPVEPRVPEPIISQFDKCPWNEPKPAFSDASIPGFDPDRDAPEKITVNVTVWVLEHDGAPSNEMIQKMFDAANEIVAQADVRFNITVRRIEKKAAESLVGRDGSYDVGDLKAFRDFVTNQGGQNKRGPNVFFLPDIKDYDAVGGLTYCPGEVGLEKAYSIVSIDFFRFDKSPANFGHVIAHELYHLLADSSVHWPQGSGHLMDKREGRSAPLRSMIDEFECLRLRVGSTDFFRKWE